MNSPQTPQPWEKALSAQHEIIGFVSSEWGKKYFRYWLDDRTNKYGTAQSSTSASAFVNALPDMMAAEPVYVTGEMQELVYNAMESFNGREMVVESDFFLRSAFVFLEEPFTVIDQAGKRVAWRAISWHMEDMTFTEVQGDSQYDEVVKKLADRYRNVDNDELAMRRDVAQLRDDHGWLPEDISRETGVPLGEIKNFLRDFDRDLAAGEGMFSVEVKMGIRFIMWSSIDDEDDYSHTFNEIDSIAKTPWLVAHALTIPLEDISKTKDTTGDKHSSTLLFIRVMNKLMGERIVTRSRYKAARSLRRHSQKINLPISEIMVVELRRRTQPSEPSGERRNYSHRFIVHGFWRRQWYPSLGMHRQKYIADYVKGPDDKPLIIKKRIWQWDR
jgi:hypothetical protein